MNIERMRIAKRIQKEGEKFLKQKKDNEINSNFNFFIVCFIILFFIALYYLGFSGKKNTKNKRIENINNNSKLSHQQYKTRNLEALKQKNIEEYDKEIEDLKEQIKLLKEKNK